MTPTAPPGRFHVFWVLFFYMRIPRKYVWFLLFVFTLNCKFFVTFFLQFSRNFMNLVFPNSNYFVQSDRFEAFKLKFKVAANVFIQIPPREKIHTGLVLHFTLNRRLWTWFFGGHVFRAQASASKKRHKKSDIFCGSHVWQIHLPPRSLHGQKNHENDWG